MTLSIGGLVFSAYATYFFEIRYIHSFLKGNDLVCFVESTIVYKNAICTDGNNFNDESVNLRLAGR